MARIRFLDHPVYTMHLSIFGYNKFNSVTAMLAELNLQKFDAVIDNCWSDFQRQIHARDDGIVQYRVAPKK